MKYIPPKKLKVIMGMFFGTGILGIIMGLQVHYFYLTAFGTINLCLGGLFGYRLLTQEKPESNKRKK
jgi:hypothetical protein